MKRLLSVVSVRLWQTEAPMMIKPFFPSMTRSELHAVLTGGFSTVSGSVMAAYIAFGISAQHLLTASFMSAPAALGMAKLLYPEKEQSRTDMSAIKTVKRYTSTFLNNFRLSNADSYDFCLIDVDERIRRATPNGILKVGAFHSMESFTQYSSFLFATDKFWWFSVRLVACWRRPRREQTMLSLLWEMSPPIWSVFWRLSPFSIQLLISWRPPLALRDSHLRSDP